jgi:hypothetical protein
MGEHVDPITFAAAMDHALEAGEISCEDIRDLSENFAGEMDKIDVEMSIARLERREHVSRIVIAAMVERRYIIEGGVRTWLMPEDNVTEPIEGIAAP